MTMLSCEHTCTAWSTERIGNKAVGKLHTVCCYTVKVGCLDITIVITAHHLRCVVVSHYIYYIILLFLFLFLFGT